jgi:hypothetical protein
MNKKTSRELRSRKRTVGFMCCVAMLVALAAPPARADFITPYSLTDFILANTNADGTVITPDGGASIILTGGNNGSGMPGFTTFVATSVSSGLVQFQFSYSSMDIPGQDIAGYLVGNVFTFLADTDGTSSTNPVSFSVGAGQSFGFEVKTVDNEFEPGILTVTNFSAPPPGGSVTTSVPEPGGGSLVLAAAIAVGLCQRILRRPLQRREE